MDEGIGHHCGLFGAYNVPRAATAAFMGLFSLQHRGQESAGIVTSDGRHMRYKKAMGLVMDVFRAADLERLTGHLAIGHVRYSTTGASLKANIQPLVSDFSQGLIAVAHNGNLVNAHTLRDEYEAYGSIFQTTTDSEVIVHLFAHPNQAGHPDGLARCLRLIKGAYNFLLMTRDKLIAVRDPQGFRPLVIGRVAGAGELAGIGEGYVVASETCALDQVGARFEREVEPGEIVTFNAHGIHSSRFAPRDKVGPKHCLFEHVYFARPDSTVFGDPVHGFRVRLGERLAREQPASADVIFPVPDSGTSAAIGFSRHSGIPLDTGFIRSHYVGRSFIKPEQVERERIVAMKFNPIRAVVEGRRVVAVDDSLIRGTTLRKQAMMLRQAGAKEVHLRISCPPTRFPCYYGIDFPDRRQLIAARISSIPEIARFLGVDSLGYQSVEGLLSAASRPPEHYCTACWTGVYPVPPVDTINKYALEQPLEEV